MGIAAISLGIIGTLCAAMGVVTAAEVIEPIMPQFTWAFWLSLSGLFILGAIAFSVSRGYFE